MNTLLANIAMEIGILSLLGVLYYFYHKRKILHYEENKVPLVMGFILQSCLTEKGEGSEPQLDALIEALDDFLHNKTSLPPIIPLKLFAQSDECSPELKNIILEGLQEIDGKE